MPQNNWSEFDCDCMEKAIALAEQGRGQVSPNPPVGCVLVKDGEIIAQGWHDHLGGLHAEQMAIANAEKNGISPNGSIAFVTLEPCNHYGRTPPCTEALLWAGVKSVIVAHEDPNPNVRGGGIETLKDAGVNVQTGLLKDSAAHQMQSFLNWCKNRIPLVTLKLALDKNGSVGSNSAESIRFTSNKSLELVHKLRRQVDAIIVGVDTVVKDDPKLTIRHVDIGLKKQPIRVVLDPTLRTPSNSELIIDENETILIHKSENNSYNEGNNVKTVYIKPNEYGIIEPENILSMLGDSGMQEVMIEGGPKTVEHFIKSRNIDRAIIVNSNIEFEDPISSGISTELLINLGLIKLEEKTIEGDLVEYWSKDNLPWPYLDWP